MNRGVGGDGGVRQLLEVWGNEDGDDQLQRREFELMAWRLGFGEAGAELLEAVGEGQKGPEDIINIKRLMRFVQDHKRPEQHEARTEFRKVFTANRRIDAVQHPPPPSQPVAIDAASGRQSIPTKPVTKRQALAAQLEAERRYVPHDRPLTPPTAAAADEPTPEVSKAERARRRAALDAALDTVFDSDEDEGGAAAGPPAVADAISSREAPVARQFEPRPEPIWTVDPDAHSAGYQPPHTLQHASPDASHSAVERPPPAHFATPPSSATHPERLGWVLGGYDSRYPIAPSPPGAKAVGGKQQADRPALSARPHHRCAPATPPSQAGAHHRAPPAPASAPARASAAAPGRARQPGRPVARRTLHHAPAAHRHPFANERNPYLHLEYPAVQHISQGVPPQHRRPPPVHRHPPPQPPPFVWRPMDPLGPARPSRDRPQATGFYHRLDLALKH